MKNIFQVVTTGTGWKERNNRLVVLYRVSMLMRKGKKKKRHNYFCTKLCRRI
jgi:hypothetical protein